MKIEKKQLDISLQFESISLPPVEDILIIGKLCPFGKMGVKKFLYLLSPDNFDTIEIESDIVDSIFINKKILKKMTEAEVLEVLEENVFPFINKNEVIKIDFKIKVSIELTKTRINKDEH
ncbi:MAG: hypothetical protein A2X12_09115 [Bacteroidetes bacterium GWE2_29_8]|nr:MAG: hypothetical protein A2X12_09115 [Bacteroidetes bacterium GWE2_29_8]OFY17144.1 MAG: hypothetical protein A2X02_09280 [Bacteroidetes bacterium GWF2_29_10]